MYASGPTSFPSLWAGTMSGHLLSFHIHFPSMQQRQSELLWAEQTGKVQSSYGILFHGFKL